MTLAGTGLTGLLIAVLAVPLSAAAPKPEARRSPLDRKTATQSEAPPSASESEEQPSTIDVLKGLQTGQLSATAEGTGDGRMTLSLSNRTNKKLRVVLPPGLIASGATGQFGGMGGFGGGMGMMGGGMGGMGMMGGGMGGMGGGMGGMGGGMGMMGGGMGGMGGGMGGMGGRGMMMGRTLPATMGMMMLGRLIMTLVGDRDSWDQRSLMMGMMGGMGMMGRGMGMGGMGMMGGMGGGFRSVPPTGLPETTLQPRQVRHLPTAVVSLNGPGANSLPIVPAKGERLEISVVERWTDDARTRTALKRLSEAKAPQTVAQMVLWYVTAGADWEDIGRLSQGWGNAHEIALARHFVAGLANDAGSSSSTDAGPLYWDIQSEGDRSRDLAEGLRALWAKHPVLGLTAKEGVPERPAGPALACHLDVSETSAEIKLAASHPSGSDWIPLGTSRIKLTEPTQKREQEAARFGDAVAEAMLGRLVRLQLSSGPRAKGKETFRIKIVNNSPMILNGLALGGAEVRKDNPPSVLAGMCLPPLKSLTVPASAEMVNRLHLKKDRMHVFAADLSGL